MQLESLGKHKEALALKQMISMTSLVHEDNKKEKEATPTDDAEATQRASQIEDARMLAAKVREHRAATSGLAQSGRESPVHMRNTASSI